MAADCHNSQYQGAPPPIVEFNDEEMTKIHANAEHTAYIRVSGAKMGRFQLGSNLHRFFDLEGRVEVTEQGYCRFSAKFSNQRDYNQAIRRSNWQISDRCSIEVFKWQPNFPFGKVPLLVDGDIVETRLEGLPVEYCIDDAVKKIGHTVCAPLGCHVLGVDSSRGKPARFWFQLISSNCCLSLPLHVKIAGGPPVGLAYSRAQQCYRCGRFGHIRRTCPDPLNQHKGFSNLPMDTCYQSGPTQVRPRHLVQEPVLIPDHGDIYSSLPEEIGCGFHTHESGLVGSSVSPLEQTSPEQQEETTPMEPFSVTEYFAHSSGFTNPPRPIQTTELGVKGAILVENGGESRSTLYNIGEEVSEIDVIVKVTHLNDQRGNRRQVNLTPRVGHATHCSKRLLFTSIDEADIRSAVRQLKDTCDENYVSMAIVLDKSSVLINHGQILRCFGFSASHYTEMIFRSFGPDGSALDVKGSCLLMWKREELHVDVSPVLYGNTELLSQHLGFSASWAVGGPEVSGSGEQDSDESSNGFSSSGEEGSIDFSDSTTSAEDNESPTLSPHGDTDSDDQSSFFSNSGEERSNNSSESSSSSNEFSILPPNGDTSNLGANRSG